MNRTMKGLTYDGPGRLTPSEVPIPEVVATDDVLVRPNYAGICFTEKHVYDGLFPTSPRQTTYATGQVWGHEFGGVVTDLGSEVADLKIGDRVAINPFMRCHACLMCQAGLYSKCEKVSCVGMSSHGGCFAEYCVVSRYQCYPVPESVSELAGCLIEPMATSTRLARRGFLTPGKTILVFGADDYNLSAVQWARIAGAAALIVVDPIPARRAAAERCGATLTVDPGHDDVTGAVRDMLGPYGADLALVSSEDYIDQAQEYLVHAFDLVRVQGEVVISRMYGNAWHSVISQVPRLKEISVHHNGVYYSEEPARGGRARGDWQQTIDYLARGDFSVEALQPLIIDLDDLASREDVAKTFADIPMSSAKVVFRIHGEKS